MSRGEGVKINPCWPAIFNHCRLYCRRRGSNKFNRIQIFLCAIRRSYCLTNGGLEAVERHAVRAVANAVERDLKSGGVALDYHPCQLFGRHAWNAAVVRVVGEGREHCRGARTERAVNVALERSQTQTERVVPERRELRALALDVRERVGELLPFGDAHVELS